jgi:nitrogen-specific signal transduction histidine kinase
LRVPGTSTSVARLALTGSPPDGIPLETLAEVLRHLREPLLLASHSGTILAANVAAAEALGASVAALAGTALADHSPDPDDRFDASRGAAPERQRHRREV